MSSKINDHIFSFRDIYVYMNIGRPFDSFGSLHLTAGDIVNHFDHCDDVIYEFECRQRCLLFIYCLLFIDNNTHNSIDIAYSCLRHQGLLKHSQVPAMQSNAKENINFRLRI